MVEFLAKKRVEDYLSHQREKDTFYVTDLVRCPLKLVYEEKFRELAIAEVYNPSTLMGELIHMGLETFNEIEGYKVISEVEGEKEVNLGEKVVKIKGRADIILQKGEEKIIVEIKSARGDKGLPHKHHLMQLQAYLWLFGAKKGILFYVTPERFTEFTVDKPLDEATIIKLVQENISLSPSPRFAWECEYCVFSIVCPNKK
ncbi:CRISPR-associated protein Cas4 [Acidianus infernus]|uniref:CRISPR-associated exonuclease Cas4 n=1 Tax=Acidianus infernus TaxID=12915 RepID=A0A6A9QG94_ACIIN|nr:CRISPR-associated protein Cas4 [Acidianus infernus]MUM64230.1 CRISPR-associated protein Cas4 [Acidianus infernus]